MMSSEVFENHEDDFRNLYLEIRKKVDDRIPRCLGGELFWFCVPSQMQSPRPKCKTLGLSVFIYMMNHISIISEAQMPHH